ncbi:MAG: hypothetical protein ACOYN0_12905 [Phycisphaerales bacterium]
MRRPLPLADFMGIDTCLHIPSVLVAAGRYGDKSGQGVFEYGQK